MACMLCRLRVMTSYRQQFAHLAHEGHHLIGARHVVHRIHGDDEICRHIVQGQYETLLRSCTVCHWQYGFLSAVVR